MAITVNEDGSLQDVGTHSRPFIAAYNGADGNASQVPVGAFHQRTIPAGETITWTFDFVPERAVFICHCSERDEVPQTSFMIDQGTTVSNTQYNNYFRGTSEGQMKCSISLIGNVLSITSTETRDYHAHFILIVV